MPSTPETRNLHKELLVLLKCFHQICFNHGIKYSLHGGTLLGAIRDKGFIPWDDDIDVVLTRQEYEKLWETLRSSKEYTAALSLDITDKDLKLWHKTSSEEYVCLDIFVYDYISEKRIMQKLKILGITFWRQLSKNRTQLEFTRTRYGKWSLKAFIATVMYYLGKLLPTKFKIEMMHKIEKSESFSGNKQLIHRSNDQYRALGLVLPKEVMAEYMLVPFEDTELMVTTSYHDVLVSSYGADYMTPKRTEEADVRIHQMTRAAGKQQFCEQTNKNKSGSDK